MSALRPSIPSATAVGLAVAALAALSMAVPFPAAALHDEGEAREAQPDDDVELDGIADDDLASDDLAGQPLAADVVSPGGALADGLDPYGSDLNRDVGYRGDVCRSDRPGRVRLMAFLDATWPAIENLWGYACREISAPGSPDCDGDWEPDYSSCWSTHASGRAIDVMVGGGANSPTPEGVALGDEVVDWLLASREGYDHYFARTMGIQQILWNDRCWSAQREDDRLVMSAGAMRHCGIRNHDNHPHLTLSHAGADGLTSWYQNN